ncbi:MAG: Lrp/AsnC ligand binding domain-containing protein [Candidatus Bathyarchaeia archaeon]|jgi:DNA-binding Lrp family transcriptional regulator
MKLSQFLASVNIFIDKSQKNNVLSELSKLQNAREVYEVAGEYDIVSIISAPTLEEFRDVLQKRVMKIKGVKSTITTVILCRHKESLARGTKNDGGRALNPIRDGKA